MRAASAPRGRSSGGGARRGRLSPPLLFRLLSLGGSGCVSGARRWQDRLLLVASPRAGVMAPWGSAGGSPAWRSAQLLLLVVSCCGRYRGSDAARGGGRTKRPFGGGPGVPQPGAGPGGTPLDRPRPAGRPRASPSLPFPQPPLHGSLFVISS